MMRRLRATRERQERLLLRDVHELGSSYYNATADAACASTIAAFTGDINSCTLLKAPPLCFVACRYAPLSLKALVARGDVDPHACDHTGSTCMRWILYCSQGVAALGRFLAAFPTFDVNAPCRGDGMTPLAVVGLPRMCGLFDDARMLEALLDAGAEFRLGMFGTGGRPDDLVWDTRWTLAALVAPHKAWSDAVQRRAWLLACVALGMMSSQQQQQLPCKKRETLPDSAVVACVLADGMRMCIPAGPDSHSHQLVSEYACIVATFL